MKFAAGLDKTVVIHGSVKLAHIVCGISFQEGHTVIVDLKLAQPQLRLLLHPFVQKIGYKSEVVAVYLGAILCHGKNGQ